MKLLTPIHAIGWAAGVFGAEKSFLANPILGSRRLNEMGLHRARVAAAERMARFRRARLSDIPADDRAAYDRDGFVIKENYLPDAIFQRVCAEVFGQLHPAREMRQGQTVTRMIPLTHAARRRAPETVSAAQDPALNRLTGYVAGRTGAPIHFIQTVIAEPQRGPADPQTALHADTFHSTAKFWLFLHDVDLEDGPFMFAPGSHKLTPERLRWEYEQSLTAKEAKRAHHSFGSFRVGADEMERFGYQPPRPIAVRANTLVIADTYGFHARSPSQKPTTRVEVHGHMRRNPFPPWNGLDIQSLPGVKGRQMDIYFAWMNFLRRDTIWKDVGLVKADAPAIT
ncbi:phytanoyl-CoA dioxygenase family protein [Pikeienuella sp. HZG-20]|uniref:phytanoyl-CoA dioxygenase family protein n=1 Tax=Paludibacillus litoralis TaxID=3133267 RepID=UPI0030ED0F81